MEFDDRNVAFQNTGAALIFAVAKTDKPYKAFELQPERIKGKDTGWYTVPKSLVFAYRAEKLADGSRMQVTRTRTVEHAQRVELFNAGIKAGLKVRPLEEPKDDAKPTRPSLTLEALMAASPSVKL